MTLYCPNCGAANEKFAQYCAGCGEDISAARDKKGKKSGAHEEPLTNDSKPKKKLYRSRTDKMVAGVSAGLAKYFNMDIDHVRILWAVAFIATGGTALILYFVMAVALELEPEVPGTINEEQEN